MTSVRVISNGSLFYFIFMCTIIDMACCMAMVFSSLKVCLMVVFGILNFSSKIFIEGMCVVAGAPTIMTISEFTFHPLFMTELVSNWYFSKKLSIILGKNLSL